MMPAFVRVVILEPEIDLSVFKRALNAEDILPNLQAARLTMVELGSYGAEKGG
jgi:hypothetical protein